jgi:hypothetical protein
MGELMLVNGVIIGSAGIEWIELLRKGVVEGINDGKVGIWLVKGWTDVL